MLRQPCDWCCGGGDAVRTFALRLVLGITIVYLTSTAQGAYPDRPIKIIVPFSPGGSTDAMARQVKREIDERNLLPQPLVIVNLEGAGSAIGSRRAKNAEPDGYTLLVLNEAIITSKYWGTVPYGPEAFESIAMTGEAGTVLTVREDCEYEDLGALLRAAKEHPRSIAAAVALGTPSHFAALGAQAALPGAEFRHAQLGGGAHRFVALKGKHVELTTFSTDEFRRFRAEGLRGLAYLGTERNPGLPEVPTALEQGFDVQRTISLYWWAPKGTPADRLAYLGDVLQQAMQGEQLQQRLRETSVEPVFLRGEALQKKLAKVEADIQSVAPEREVEANSEDADAQQSTLPNLVLWTVSFIVIFAGWSAVEWARQPSTMLAGEAPSASSSSSQTTPANSAELHVGKMIGAVLLAAIFVMLLTVNILPLGYSIAIFMLTTGGLLGAFRERELGAALVVLTILLSSGFHYLFTQLFIIDL